MQALIMPIFFLVLLLPLNAAASKKPAGNLVLSIAKKNDYGLERTRIFQEGKSYYCITDLSPHVPVMDKAGVLALVADAKVYVAKNKNAKPGSCREHSAVALANNSAAGGCADDRSAQKLLVQAAKLCGRY